MSRITQTLAALTLLASGAVCAANTAPTSAEMSAELEQFRQTWQSKGVSTEVLDNALAQAERQQGIIDAITRPWEAKPWYQYRTIFHTEARLQAGLEFWQQNEQALNDAYAEFGVEPEIVVAIIGVETLYGRHLGKHKVLDALYTLGFHYPPRQTFFRKELGHFLQLASEQGWPLDQPLGSYAGAMGLGQFIPSSYQAYAVDFDGDGKRDLINNRRDAIGSVANYFARHNWQKGQPVEQTVSVSDAAAVESLLWNGKKLSHSASALQQAGIAINGDEGAALGLLKLDSAADAVQYHLVYPNFYSITRYNHSPLYAMAVWQFSQQLKQAKRS
ncbi:lytic murein transglycosylase B [Ferrimonas senticii]|uniref:lytic murein transglycosylase B n=1 Tax=Ferrimonas senticii TaxID=394566 RepID=UPI000419410A|nr:lytic murein transglycosylase B [Ferrimonas senticii]